MQARETRTGARGERRGRERRGRSPSEEKIRDCDRISDLAICRFSRLHIRELKQLRRRPQRRLQKNSRFNDQNNSFLVHHAF